MSVWMSKFVRASLLGPYLAATAMAAANPPGIDNAALTNEADGVNWAAYGRSFSEQHYSPLRQINAGNVSRLGLA
jgi:quinohemoprotein ethanol dehydrogenase